MLAPSRDLFAKSNSELGAAFRLDRSRDKQFDHAPMQICNGYVSIEMVNRRTRDALKDRANPRQVFAALEMIRPRAARVSDAMNSNGRISIQNQNQVRNRKERLHQAPDLLGITSSRALVCDARIEITVQDYDFPLLERRADQLFDMLRAVLKKCVQFLFWRQAAGCRGFANQLSPWTLGRFSRNERAFAGALQRVSEQLHLSGLSGPIDALEHNKNGSGGVGQLSAPRAVHERSLSS